MCLLIETIKVFNGHLLHLEDHIKRMQKTRKLLFGKSDTLQLNQLIDMAKNCEVGIYKCSIKYHHQIESIDFNLYQMKSIKVLQLVYNDAIIYNEKYANRDQINKLYAQKETADEILIIKNDCLTDSSYTNVALFDGLNWYTPMQPLFLGTQRQRLLNKSIIIEKEINKKDILNYQKIAFFNAMVEFGDIVVDISTNTIRN